MANKKVSQLVAKPSVLVTDLFPIADPTTGQLFKTTISDLGTAIGSGVSSVNTLVGAVVLDTDDIQELASPTNRWYTDTRARAAISAGTGISYNSGTGVITNAVTSGQIATALGYTPADDALVVKLAGSQTITGTKTFQQAPLMDIGVGYKNGSGVYNYLKSINTGWEMPVNGQNHNLIFSTSTNYVYTFPNASGTIALTSDLSNYVALTGDQTVAGIKTFTSNVKGTQFMVGTPFDTSRSFSAAGNQNSIAIWLEEYTSAGGGAPDLFFNNGRGTISSKANIQVGDGLGGITWAGYVNANFNASVVLGTIVTNIDATNNHANADFAISQSYNSSTLTENLRLYANGGGLYIRGNVQGASFVKAGGTSAQFLKADGSVDSSTYLTTATALSTYLPLSGGTLTGALSGTTATFSGIITSNRIINAVLMATASTTNRKYLEILNDGGQFYAGVGASTSNSIFTGQSAYSTVLGSANLTPLELATNGAVRITITGGGAVGIGISSPNTQLHIVGSLTVNDSIYLQRASSSLFLPIASYWNGSGSPLAGTKGDIVAIGNAAGDGLVFVNSNTERMRIDVDGSILVGKTSKGFATAGSQFESVGRTFGVTSDAGGENIFLHRSASNTGNLMAFFYNSGGVGSISTNGTTTSFNITSDYRLKQDLKTIKGLEIVNKIKVYDYQWKSDNTRMDGVMAHELAEVLPYAVTGVKDGEQMQQVDYSKIVPVMVQAIKDLKAKIETLENK